MNHVVTRSVIYFLVCYLSYAALSWASPEVDYSAKGIVLLDRYAEASTPVPADEVRILPFQPENTEAVAWINIEKAETDDYSRELVEQKARELAGSVGADGIVVVAEGATMNLGPSKYPLFILRGKAVKISRG